MPEGDTIFRAARTLHRALQGRVVTAFESVFPRLTRVDVDRPLRGRTIERVEARGKHLLIWFSGDLVLRTHMRMTGSWHIYRPGERWQRPRADMRIVVRTDGFEAVAFNVPVAALETASELDRQPAVRDLGPDALAPIFDAGEAIRRIMTRPDAAIADALLDQRSMSGVGNIYKSETLFVTRVNPFTPVRDLDADRLGAIVAAAARLLAANVAEASAESISPSGGRSTTGRWSPAERMWVYGRRGKPCRRCGTAIERALQGPHARATYWCPSCQAE